MEESYFLKSKYLLHQFLIDKGGNAHFHIDELSQYLLRNDGILRTSPGVSIVKYLNYLEAREILYFKPGHDLNGEKDRYIIIDPSPLKDSIEFLVTDNGQINHYLQ